MPIRVVEVTRRFVRQYRKLPKRILDAAREKEVIFRANPFDPRLHTHKLHGKEQEAWAFWVTHSYRVTFIFLSGDRVLFLEIGAHDIYR